MLTTNFLFERAQRIDAIHKRTPSERAWICLADPAIQNDPEKNDFATAVVRRGAPLNQAKQARLNDLYLQVGANHTQTGEAP